jgi:carbon storage regulator
MLVLSRKPDESIRIGDEIEITVIEVRGDVVKIGISAPRSVSVYRKEIYDAIQRENIAASESVAGDLTKVARAC